MRTRARVALFLLGVAALLGVALYAYGGPQRLFQYSAHFAHKFTARAMMNRSLVLDRSLFGITMNDEQVYNGAGFTNWGFGVPLLQIPFHALVPLFGSHIRSRYFPDRLIFFIYLAGLFPVLWTALVRACASETGGRPAPVTTWLCAWAAALLALSYALFPLTSYRFIAYEETIAYFVVTQFYALSFYIRFVQSKKPSWLCAIGIAASFGLLIRATGLPYLALWIALCVLSDRRWRTAALFCAAAAPLIAFWMYTNWVKGGSPWTFGYQNGLPEFSFHYSMQRFDNRCEEVSSSLWTSVKWLFSSLFLHMPDTANVIGAQSRCHFIFETRMPGTEPFFPPTVLAIWGGSLLYHALHRRALAYFLPQAMFAALFLAFAKSAVGFTYRYAGDFWPLVVLVLVQLAPAARLDERPRLGLSLALLFTFYSAVTYIQDIEPALGSIAAVDGAQVAAIDEEHWRIPSEAEPTLPTRVACGEPLPSWPRANGKGWGRGCEVDTVTNLFLGVRKRTDSVYHLRFKVDHPISRSLRVYVNGKYYDAHLNEDGEYVTEVVIKFARLHSPGVMVTVEWTPQFMPLPLKLLEMQLG
jgi:hypothetical protein